MALGRGVRQAVGRSFGHTCPNTTNEYSLYGVRSRPSLEPRSPPLPPTMPSRLRLLDGFTCLWGSLTAGLAPRAEASGCQVQQCDATISPVQKHSLGPTGGQRVRTCSSDVDVTARGESRWSGYRSGSSSGSDSSNNNTMVRDTHDDPTRIAITTQPPPGTYKASKSTVVASQ
jgi:hypothetical protein